MDILFVTEVQEVKVREEEVQEEVVQEEVREEMVRKEEVWEEKILEHELWQQLKASLSKNVRGNLHLAPMCNSCSWLSPLIFQWDNLHSSS